MIFISYFIIEKADNNRFSFSWSTENGGIVKKVIAPNLPQSKVKVSGVSSGGDIEKQNHGFIIDEGRIIIRLSSKLRFNLEFKEINGDWVMSSFYSKPDTDPKDEWIPTFIH